MAGPESVLFGPRPSGGSVMSVRNDVAPRALLIRSNEFAITPALPRFAEVLTRILPAGSVHALCWRTDPRVVTPVPAMGVSVVHYERRASSRSFSGILAMPLWWLRIWQELFRLRPVLVQTSDV